MKKVLFLLSFSVLLLSSSGASASSPEINFFHSPTCPHCIQEQAFLDELQQRYPDIIINRYSVEKRENVDLLRRFYKEYNVPQNYHGMVPATFTKERYFIGFGDKVAQDIEECLLNCRKDDGGESKGDFSLVDLDGNISIPIIGKINVKNFSFPVLAVILGTLDGFNICSLGALVLILGLVLVAKSRKKTLIFGGAFILTTALVYGTLIVIWYQIFSFFTLYLRAMQIAIGLLGIGGGIYFFNQFLKYRKYGPACEVSSGRGTIVRFSDWIRSRLSIPGSMILILAAILVFAAIIVIIEFPCSAVIPVAFAGILAEAGLSLSQYLFYIALFTIFYMLDEIIVFLIAFFTMKVWLVSGKSIVWITLAQSIILFILGVRYLIL